MRKLRKPLVPAVHTPLREREALLGRRLFVDRANVNVGAVDDGKAAVVPGESQEQVGAAQQHGLGAAIGKPATGLEEGAALLVGDTADARHVAVALLDALELLALGGDDLGLGDLAVELARHDDARADDAYALQATLVDGVVDRIKAVDERQRRDRL